MVRNAVLLMTATTALALCAFVGTASGQGSSTTSAESYAGAWTGTWEGAGGGGGFELTLEKPKDGPMTGKVSVTGEPTYKANLKTLAFDGAKMTAKYDFTPDENAEVVLTATFDGKGAAAGEWSLREKASGNEVASGTWKVKKQ